MNVNRTVVSTDKAPSAIGPYSQAVKTDSMVYVSGQLAFDPATGNLITDDIKTETRQAMNNLKTILEAAGSSLANALKVTVFLTDLGNFARVDEIMAQYFPEPYPARAAFEVSALPKGAAVEADVILAG